MMKTNKMNLQFKYHQKRFKPRGLLNPSLLSSQQQIPILLLTKSQSSCEGLSPITQNTSSKKVFRLFNLAKVCCSVKPSNLKLHLPATTGNTIYNKDFHRKPFASADKIQPMDAFRTSYPFFGATNYNVIFVLFRLASFRIHLATSPENRI